MSNGYQIERLLRPKVEIYSVITSLSCAAVCLFLTGFLLMPPVIAYAAGMFFAYKATVRYKQYSRLSKYQKGLVLLPYFALALNKIPVSKKTLYFGKGFIWTAKHTQRLRDCALPQNEQYVEMPKLYERVRSFSNLCDVKGFSTISNLLDANLVFNPFKPLPPVGGKPAIHGVGLYEGEKHIYTFRGERVAHTIVVGTTRVGKTRLAEVLITQDILAGETVIVIDPKGDEDLLKTCYQAALLADREDDFITFHLAYPEYSARYNPLGSYSRITEVATRLTNALPSSGNAASFKEFGWRFSNIIARALHFLGERSSYEAIRKYIDNVDSLIIKYGESWLESQIPGQWQDKVAEQKYGLTGGKDDKNKPRVPARTNAERSRDIDAVCVARVLANYMEENKINDPVSIGLLSAFKYEKTYFDKIVSSLGPFLEKLTTGKVSELLSPNYDDIDDPRPIFSAKSLIRSNGILYIGLAALQDTVVASAVGNAFFNDLTATAGQLYAYGSKIGETVHDEGVAKVSVHADEFNELIGDEFIPLLNKAGGAGVQVTAYTQTWSDVEARLGDKAKALQVAGNLNTIVMMRVLSPETAQMLTDKLPKVEVSKTTLVSGSSQSSKPNTEEDFSSSVQDRITSVDVPMLEPQDLAALPKGQAFILSEGGKLTKIRLPRSKPVKGLNLPKNIQELTKNMRADMKRDYRDNWMNDPFINAHIAFHGNSDKQAEWKEVATNKHAQALPVNDSQDQSMNENLEQMLNG